MMDGLADWAEDGRMRELGGTWMVGGLNRRWMEWRIGRKIDGWEDWVEVGWSGGFGGRWMDWWLSLIHI